MRKLSVFIITQIIMDVVHVVNSFLQWAPENITVTSSSRSVYTQKLIMPNAHTFPCSMVESFESIVSTYVQQLSLNEVQTFTTLSLTVVTALVRKAKYYTMHEIA